MGVYVCSKRLDVRDNVVVVSMFMAVIIHETRPAGLPIISINLSSPAESSILNVFNTSVGPKVRTPAFLVLENSHKGEQRVRPYILREM